MELEWTSIENQWRSNGWFPSVNNTKRPIYGSLEWLSFFSLFDYRMMRPTLRYELLKDLMIDGTSASLHSQVHDFTWLQK